MSNKLKKTQKPLILLGVPALDNAPIEFTDSLLSYEWPTQWAKRFVKGADIGVNRDVIVNYAFQIGATHILFVDTDIIAPADALKRLLEHDADIVSGVYYKKAIPSSPVLWNNTQFNSDGDVASMDVVTDIPTYGEVDQCGFGFTLVKLQVFKDIIDKYHCCFRKGFNVGEDFSFCIRARELGYKVMVDGTIPIKHIGSYMYTINDCISQRGE